MNTKISEAAVDVAAFAVPSAVPTLEHAKKVVRRVVALYLKHSQPAELAEQQGADPVELQIAIEQRDRWRRIAERNRNNLDLLAATGRQQVGEVQEAKVSAVLIHHSAAQSEVEITAAGVSLGVGRHELYADPPAQGIDPKAFREVVDCLDDTFHERGGWAVEEVLIGARALIDGQRDAAPGMGS